MILLDASAYISWAKEYYERDVDAHSVIAIYADAVLSPTLLKSFGVADRRDQISADAAEIGWPLV